MRGPHIFPVPIDSDAVTSPKGTPTGGGRTLALILLAMLVMFAVIVGLAMWAAG